MSENSYLGKNLVILSRENFRILQDQKEIMSFAENRDLHPNAWFQIFWDFTSVFRTQANIYDKIFWENSERLLVVGYLCESFPRGCFAMI